MNNKVFIYLDDLREAPEGYARVKSVNEAISLIESLEIQNIDIELIDLDHDLGDFSSDGGDAIKLLDWLVERKTFYPVTLHTMNVVGRDNMQKIIDKYWK